MLGRGSGSEDVHRSLLRVRRTEKDEVRLIPHNIVYNNDNACDYLERTGFVRAFIYH